MSGYLPQLDGLRAVAIALVVIHHAVFPASFGGQVGVDVFFVLSGYLITTVLLKEHEARGHVRFKTFYARRLVRLYPALLIAVALFAIPGLLIASNKPRFVSESISALTYTMPYLITLTGVGEVWRHTWSLGIEELFYLLWPAALVALLRWMPRRAPMLLAASGLVGLAVLTVSGANIGMFLRMCGMLLGCAIAMYLPGRGVRLGTWVTVVGCAAIVVAAIVGSAPRFEMAAAALASVGAALVVAHLATRRRSAPVRVLSWGPFVYVGRISYEIYLFHFPLLVLGSWLIRGTQAQAAWFAIPLALILSGAVHRLTAPLVKRLKTRLPY